MLKKTRVLVAIAILTLITFYFIDFTGALSERVHWLAAIQFIPAVLALNIGVFAFLTVLTLVCGRVYCSTICPMGVFQDVITRIAMRTNKKKRKKGFAYSSNKSILRYAVLGISIVCLLFGFTLTMALIEPYSAYGRVATHLFKPAYMSGNNLLASATASTGEYWFQHTEVVIQSLAALSIAIATILIIGFLAWRYGRTYCNTICPAGTVLGTISKFSLFKIRVNNELCNSCGLCERKCKASCINSKEKTIDYSRCVACFNCLQGCKRNAIAYALPRKIEEPTADASTTSHHAVNQQRRQFLTGAVVTTIAAPLALAKEKKNEAVTLFSEQKAYKKAEPISPPGSLGHKHLSQHCTSCHLCINRCPQKILTPALLDYGLGGIMQPVISYEESFCKFDCTICADVCPNGAIKSISVQRKQATQIGHAIYVPENCIVNARHIKCGACARKCPVNAITMVPASDGLEIPSVDTKKCIGCGACEYICPSHPYRGIYVEGNKVQTLTTHN